MAIPSVVVGRPLEESGVLITGGTSGAGLAAALQFAASGVKRIALVGRDEARGARARETLMKQSPQAQVRFIPADANQVAQATRAAGEARDFLGRIDVLVNSTLAEFTPQLFHATAIEDIQPIIFERLMAPLLMCRAVLPWMREQRSGVIINVASDAAKVATPGESVIATAMAGLVIFSRTLAMEAKRDGIRVNALTPSLISGTQAAERHLQGGFSARIFDKVASRAHLGLAQPEDIGALIVFLASPQAVRITGQAISVNGGISAA
jgi:NAD(P)-dependent dehydrogenase (short-subunit alcohol dehydrogenase family)